MQASNIQYRCDVRKEKYIYAKCKYRRCHAAITYKLNEDAFQMTKITVTHNHSAIGAKSSAYRKAE
jgi:hypothetical protein